MFNAGDKVRIISDSTLKNSVGIIQGYQNTWYAVSINFDNHAVIYAFSDDELELVEEDNMWLVLERQINEAHI